MRTIELLEQSTIDQIAAGEVVERPASVVKELIENAIDADANAITVEIRDGGASLIRITDNGSGIPADQIRLAFTRHATSKLRNIDDLLQIRSLGFRGEALSSIAAVARVELITRDPEALTGVRFCIEGGVETDYEEIGAPAGTTFLVRNLFYNTPARAKFLKTPTAETNRVFSIVEELALSHPQISFKLLINGQSKLFTGGNGNRKELIYQIFGRELAAKLIPIESQSEQMRISGYLGNPDIARGNRNFENYFVNHRYVKNQLIAKAIEDGYHGFMMQHRYPFVLLYLEMNPELIDVNVHPSKMEIRIQQQDVICHQLTLAIQNALFERERIPEISLQSRTRSGSGQKEAAARHAEARSAPEPFEARRRAAGAPAAQTVPEANQPAASAHPTYDSVQQNGNRTQEPDQVREEPGTYRREKQSAAAQSDSAAGTAGAEQMELFPEKFLAQAARPMHRLIGQLFGTYWLIEFQDALYIVDQHAAHEKVLYERLMKSFREKTIHSQLLRPAKVLSLSASEAAILTESLETFTALGFEIESFGGTDFRITAVPDNLYGLRTEQLFTDVLDSLSATDTSGHGTLVPEKLASMACRAAVKGNHSMSASEADALINELLTLENPYNCPHGRPTIVSMTHHELDRKFKRIL